jgi:formylglycine-generating enzyme required for sulfatase activity
MHGNLWEWCQHPQNPRARERVLRLEDRPAITRESTSDPAIYFEARGGAYSYGPELVRSAARNRSSPDGAVTTFGFRVARTWPSEN